jgi:hypothetical protein
MALQIRWDNEITRFRDERFDLRIRTGQSQAIRNLLTGLRVRDAGRAQRVERAIFAIAEQLSQSLQGADPYPGVPEMVYGRIQDGQREVEICVVSGIVPNGSRRGSALSGEYRLVVIRADELEACLSRVFDFERLLGKAVCP